MGKIAYVIGYGAIRRGCYVSLNPYPWECFVTTKVR